MELIDVTNTHSHLLSPFTDTQDKRQWVSPVIWDSYYRPPLFSFTECRSGTNFSGDINASKEEKQGFLEVKGYGTDRDVGY